MNKDKYCSIQLICGDRKITAKVKTNTTQTPLHINDSETSELTQEIFNMIKNILENNIKQHE